MTIHVIAALVAQPKWKLGVRGALGELVSASRKEPGNQRYDLYVDAVQPDTFHLIEAYVDDAALDAHRASEHYRAYREKTAGWLLKPTTVHVLEAVDVAASP